MFGYKKITSSSLVILSGCTVAPNTTYRNIPKSDRFLYKNTIFKTISKQIYTIQITFSE